MIKLNPGAHKVNIFHGYKVDSVLVSVTRCVYIWESDYHIPLQAVLKIFKY